MRQVLSSAFTHYLLIITQDDNGESGVQLAQVPAIVYENDRITSLTVTTVTLTRGGTYRYEIYGQNSASNLNPNDISVVGSANFTSNPRIEAGHISTNPQTADFHAAWMMAEINNAAPFGVDMRKKGKADGRA
jgi:hypothetical protein